MCSRTSMAWPEWNGNQLARIVLGEGDAAGSFRLRHDQGQSREETLPSTFERHHRDVHLRVFPEQDVMSEVDAVAGGEVQIGDRDVEPFDLARGVAELKFRHVLAGRQLSPSAFRGRGHGECRATTRACTL